jgi:hypothetical protein
MTLGELMRSVLNHRTSSEVTRGQLFDAKLEFVDGYEVVASKVFFDELESGRAVRIVLSDVRQPRRAR